jgi:hypothetical protein
VNIYFSPTSLKSGAMTFPLVVLFAALPFLGNAPSLLAKNYGTPALSCFALIGIVLFCLALGSFFNALEFFFLRRAPAIIFEPDAMYVRRVGRKGMAEICFSDIQQFYIEENQTRSGVTRTLLILLRSGGRYKILCDNLDVAPQELQKLLMKKTPDISYQG